MNESRVSTSFPVRIALCAAFLFFVTAGCQPEGPKEMREKARQLSSEKKYKEAADLFEKALAIDREATGTDHPQYRKNLSELAQAYMSMGNADLAISVQKEALAIARKIFGEAHVFGKDSSFAASPVANDLNTLGFFNAVKGSIFEAREYYKQAHEINLKLFGPESGQVGHDYHLMGWSYAVQKDFAPAREYFEKNLAIQQKLGNAQEIKRAQTDLNFLKQNGG